jgi:hypothetical protein
VDWRGVEAVALEGKATTSTSVLRLQKMMPFFTFALVIAARNAARRVRGSPPGSMMTRCVIVLAVVAGRVASMRFGLERNCFGEARDFRRHRGGEEQRLARERRQFEDAFDVGDEAHVEHAVGFVDDHDLHAGEQQLAALKVIEQAARRCDQHIDAACEQRVLVAKRHAADEQRFGELLILAVLVEVLATCAASSRVGSRISVRGMRARARPAARMSIIGSVKAAVLPVPV